MIRAISLAGACLCAIMPAIASADDIEEYVKRCQQDRPRQIGIVKQQLAQVEGSLAAARRSRNENAVAQSEGLLAELRVKLARLNDPTKPYALEMLTLAKGARSPLVGDIGSLPGAFEVIQVIDDKNLLASVYTFDEATIWFTNFPTAGMVDDSKEFFDESQAYRVTGTKKYENALGVSRTVHVIEPVAVPAELYAKHAGLAGPARPKPKGAPKRELDARTWKDASGRFSIEAVFSGLIGGEVRLKRDDGTTISVPLEKLSQADRDYVESLRN